MRTNARRGGHSYLTKLESAHASKSTPAQARREQAGSQEGTQARAAVECEAVAPKAEEERGVFDEQLFGWYQGIKIAVLVFGTSIVMVDVPDT